jgi:hypothetical protein
MNLMEPLPLLPSRKVGQITKLYEGKSRSALGPVGVIAEGTFQVSFFLTLLQEILASSLFRCVDRRLDHIACSLTFPRIFSYS